MSGRVEGQVAQLLGLLAEGGPANAAALCRRLGISQPTFSRLVRACSDRILITGRARSTVYAARRTIEGVSVPIPVYELRPSPGSPRLLMHLHPVEPRGFYAGMAGTGSWTFFRDLPWFLDVLRPSGYLGRLEALRHPELAAPPDIRLWSADDVLRFATTWGWSLPGAFIVGDRAYSEFLRHALAPPDLVSCQARRRRYPAIAAEVLAFGTAGSSAAGEQPKFLATLGCGASLVPVLVKFSPPVSDPAGRRVADLLVSEHLALETLRKNGFASPASTVLSTGGRVFLEVCRFDRDGLRHRIGQAALESLDAALVGSSQRSWSASVEHLARLGWADASDLRRAKWLELFGRLIGNTNMHFGNVAFFLDGTSPAGLAPPYDMLPMHYFPRHQEVSTRPFPLPELVPSWQEVAIDVIQAAADFWSRVAKDRRVSPQMRAVAKRDRCRVLELSSVADLLPRSRP